MGHYIMPYQPVVFICSLTTIFLMLNKNHFYKILSISQFFILILAAPFSLQVLLQWAFFYLLVIFSFDSLNSSFLVTFTPLCDLRQSY